MDQCIFDSVKTSKSFTCSQSLSVSSSTFSECTSRAIYCTSTYKRELNNSLFLLCSTIESNGGALYFDGCTTSILIFCCCFDECSCSSGFTGSAFVFKDYQSLDNIELSSISGSRIGQSTVSFWAPLLGTHPRQFKHSNISNNNGPEYSPFDVIYAAKHPLEISFSTVFHNTKALKENVVYIAGGNMTKSNIIENAPAPLFYCSNPQVEISYCYFDNPNNEITGTNNVIECHFNGVVQNGLVGPNYGNYDGDPPFLTHVYIGNSVCLVKSLSPSIETNQIRRQYAIMKAHALIQASQNC